MSFDFDTVIDRKNTSCSKYDSIALRGLAADTLPMWVADMDFAAPPIVRERLKEIVDQNLYGYTFPSERYQQAVINWFDGRFGWRPAAETMIQTPGLVFAVTVAILAYTKEGEGVLLQEPVYHPFRATITANRRRPVANELQLREGKYEIDFADFERRIREENVKLFVLCSPHNPVGRVWTVEELTRMGEICLSHGVIVVSDEIHADFVYGGHRHHVFSSLDKRFEANSLVCTAASKTFNLAGLDCSNVFVADFELRRIYSKALNEIHVNPANMMGLAATEAAYSGGEAWLEALLAYLSLNVETVGQFLKTHLADVKLIEPEGTYLLWLDFRALNLPQAELSRLLLREARVWMNDGKMFGAGGIGFHRMNVACPRSVVLEALERIAGAVHQFKMK